MPKMSFSSLRYLLISILMLLNLSSVSYAVVGEVSTVIGNDIGDGGPAIDAVLSRPEGAVADYYGNVYIADTSAHRIRKMSREGGITTLIGTGFAGFSGDGAAATDAQFNSPSGVAVDTSGNFYVADTLNHRIRKVNNSGVITTVAGTGSAGYSGDGGLATAAQFDSPVAIAVDSDGNIYIADTANHRIRKVNAVDGLISTVAGTGVAGYSGDDGAATAAQLNFPKGLAVSGSSVIFIADWANSRIRRVGTDGVITTYAGTGVAGDSGDAGPAITAQLNRPRGLSLDAFGRLYLVDEAAHRIRYINENSWIIAFAGDGSAGFSDSSDPNTGRFDNPTGVIAHQSGIVYVVDTNNSRIRRIRTANGLDTVVGIGPISFGGDGGDAGFAKFNNLSGIAIDSLGNRYLADSLNHRLRKIDLAGVITTIAGTGIAGFSGDGGQAITAQLDSPISVALDGDDNIYIVDSVNQRIRMIDVSGNMSTVAGTGVAGYNGGGISAVTAQLQSPTDIAFDDQGDLYIADYANERVRKITGGIISTVVGTGNAGFSGDGGLATSAEVHGVRAITFDADGHLFLVDELNDRVRKVDLSGVITTVVGTGTNGFSGDGGLATAAELSSPRALDFDASGNLYVADWANHRVRKIAVDGNITTVAGDGVQGYRGDGGAAAAARINFPSDVLIDEEGHLLIIDANDVVRRVEGNQAPTDILFNEISLSEHSDTRSPLTVGSLASVDPNSDDTHSYLVTGGVDQASFLANGSLLQFQAGIVLNYETQSSYNIELTSTDAGGMSVVKPVTVTLLDANDPPQGNLSVSGVLIEHGVLSAYLNDLFDPDGFGEFSYQWLRNGSVITEANRAEYLLISVDVGSEISLRLRYADGNGADEEVLTIAGVIAGDLDGDGIIDGLDDDIDGDGMDDEFELANGLNPRFFDDAAMDSDGDSRSNLDEYLAGSDPLLDDVAPVISLPADIYIDATALISDIDIGLATAIDAVDGPVLVRALVDDYRFFPGANVVVWSASDGAGNNAQAEQKIYVTPMVNFVPGQVAVEGNRVTVGMVLNGQAPIYPVTVPYQISGSARVGEDHDLVDGELVFDEGETLAQFSFEVLIDSQAESEETIIVSMGEPVNAVVGMNPTHQVSLLEGNIAPSVKLWVEQKGISTRILTQDGGEVVVHAVVDDLNANDRHVYDWSLTDNNLIDVDNLAETFSFDPQSLSPGFYRIQVDVSDGESGHDYHLYVEVIATAPSLSLGDSDGDGQSDSSEGFGDSDSDGIPDYLDAILPLNALQSQRVIADQYLIETEPGLMLQLGRIAMLASGAQVGVSQNDVTQHAENSAEDAEYFYAGGLFDFNVEGLPTEGATVAIVLPQQRQIPLNATYRKSTDAGWADFYEDEYNTLSSAAGDEGYCPPPNSAAYSPGLSIGYWCVQLKIQEGGPNDADGLRNRRIEDPSGIAQLRDTTKPSGTNSGGGGGNLGGLWLLLLLSVMVYRQSLKPIPKPIR